ncbi:hypothetical protein BDN70DRAFT_773884, partial [Pholiota conissans]
MALPKGIPTLKHFVTKRYTRPDNVWCTAGILEDITRCETDTYLQPPYTDHFPIVTIVDMPQVRTLPTPSHNFRMADWEAFCEDLSTRVLEMPEPAEITTKEELQEAAAALTNAMQETIKATIKVNKPCPNSKRWWNMELDNLRREVNKLSRLAYRFRAFPEHECHEEHRLQANEY